MTELFCHEANVGEFNAALRDHPDLRAFAAALHQAGMIDGLRGARLRPADAPRPENLQGVTPVLSDAAERRLADRWWQRQQEAKA
jgi:hypothetical protein